MAEKYFVTEASFYIELLRCCINNADTSTNQLNAYIQNTHAHEIAIAHMCAIAMGMRLQSHPKTVEDKFGMTPLSRSCNAMPSVQQAVKSSYVQKCLRVKLSHAPQNETKQTRPHASGLP
jgi:hypothetical protein